MNSQRKHESGQAIVLLALTMVVLLGFTALAIDGGMVYSDRRHAQNAADTAALAGASAAGAIIQEGKVTIKTWSCQSILNAVTDIASDTAIHRAGSNGYTITRSGPDNWVEVYCVDSGRDKYIYVRTYILRDTQTSFAHLLYGGPLQNRVEASARVRPQAPIAIGDAVVATNPLACSGNTNGLQFIGTSLTQITGGGAFTMGCLDVNGVGNQSSYIDAEGVIYMLDWDGTYADKFINGPPVMGDPNNYQEEDMFIVPPPDCSGLTARTQPAGSSGTLLPGRYPRIRVGNNETWTLEPGLYCLTNTPDALTMTGGSLTGIGVTIYASNGNINLTGGTVELIAPCTKGDAEGTGGDPQSNLCDTTSYPDPAISKVVLYSNKNITFVGNGASLITGMVYAPTGTVTFSGTTDISPTLNTQIIGKNVLVGGTGRLVINYDEDNSYNKPAKLDMVR